MEDMDMKTQEELKQIKEEYDLLKSKLNELNDDELKQVTGGINRAADDGAGLQGVYKNKSAAGGLYNSSDDSVITIKDQQFR